MKEALPFYLLATKGYGMSVQEINWSCPADLEPYVDAYILGAKKRDEDMWIMGKYVHTSLCVLADNIIGGKKSKAEYPEMPFSQMAEEESLPQEEIDRREIQKMLLGEEMWNEEWKRKGLPETSMA